MNKKDKLTPWFPPGIKPVHIGVYPVKFRLYPGQREQIGYAYWTGKMWTNSSDSVKFAYIYKDWTEGAVQQKSWRGFAQKPKGEFE